MAIKVTMNLVVLSLVVVAAALVQSSRAQTLHVVGDTLGWTIPPGGSVAYTTWAATQTFAVGDVLLFNFTTGAHDVVEAASKTAYDNCSPANALSTENTGPTNITLKAGEHFYICSFGTHCTQLGQKLAINVSTTATSSPSPTGNNTTSPPPPSSTTNSPPPPSSTTTSPPPPSSAAQPLAVAAALPITLFSIFVALLH